MFFFDGFLHKSPVDVTPAICTWQGYLNGETEDATRFRKYESAVEMVEFLEYRKHLRVTIVQALYSTGYEDSGKWNNYMYPTKILIEIVSIVVNDIAICNCGHHEEL